MSDLIFLLQRLSADDKYSRQRVNQHEHSILCVGHRQTRSSLEYQTDWIKIRPNVRPNLPICKDYQQTTRIVGKKLTNISIVSFLWGIDKPDVTECVISTTRVQTVWIQTRPDLTSDLIWVKHDFFKNFLLVHLPLKTPEKNTQYVGCLYKLSAAHI